MRCGDLCAGPAVARPVSWCSTWVSSRPVTIFRGRRSRARSGVPPADVAVLSVRPGSTGGRSHCARGTPGPEPAALVAQAADAVARADAAGMLAEGGRVTEYGSPHGGSWLDLLGQRGLTPVPPGEPADVVLDCFGLMHAADQSAALAERVARVAPGGVLLLQYHSLDAIIRGGQWNALRHGHYAYYSAAALSAMLAAQGFRARRAWQFELYGGTVLLAACLDGDPHLPADDSVASLLSQEAAAGVRDPAALGGLQRDARAKAQGLHDWLVAQRSAGNTVLGYGAASRAVALLRWAEADQSLIRAVADASPAKQGLRMPGTDIPVVTRPGSPITGRLLLSSSWPTFCQRSGQLFPRLKRRVAAG